MFKNKKILGFLVVAFAVSACGGGGDSVPSFDYGTPEGHWQTSQSSSGTTLDGLILDDGTFWFVYSTVGNGFSVPAGFFQSNSQYGVGVFSTWNSLDVNFEGTGISINGVLVAGEYIPKMKLSGSLNFRRQVAESFSATYERDYDLTPSLAIIAGTYSGTTQTLGGAEFATVVITDTGAIFGLSASGCTFTGTASPRPKGNVYNISVTFGGGACSNGTDTVSGVGFTGGNGMIVMARNNDHTSGLLAEIAKQ
jgi:hypothetical protein